MAPLEPPHRYSVNVKRDGLGDRWVWEIQRISTSRGLLPRIRTPRTPKAPRAPAGCECGSHPAYTNLSLFRRLSCRPTAPPLPLCRTETSVRRRFLSSSRTSHSLPVCVYVACRMQSAREGQEIRRRSRRSPPSKKTQWFPAHLGWKQPSALL
jgi:hypothetical protein